MDYHTPTLFLRSDFLLDPSVVYLNHGSFGATPRPVFESYQRWQLELERQPTEFLGRRAPTLLAESRAALAAYLGARAEDLVYVTNATVGLNVVARSLDLKAGDEVLATDHEYGALDRTFQFLARSQGFRYINHPVPVALKKPAEWVDDFWRGVTTRTRVIFISHITSPTALIFPVGEVCARAREQGILTVIDGAHVPGQIPLNLDEVGADFYAGNLHKWLCAPKGAAFLHARPEMHARIQPLVISWGWQPDAPSAAPLVDYVEWAGTRDLSAFLAVPDAIRYQHEHSWPAVQRRGHELAIEAVRRVCAISGLEPISGSDGYAQMVSIPLPEGIDAPLIHRRLYEDHRIEAPFTQWNGRVFIRCSFQAYNCPEDIDRLEVALRRLLG